MLFRESYIKKLHELVTKTKVVTLLGARQVGKTTLMKQFEQEITGPSLYINCEDFFERPFKSIPEMKTWLRNEYGFDIEQAGFLFLDEIQAWPDPDRIIKSYYDNSSIQANMIVTGSRFWGQMTVGTSMVGRGEVLYVYGYSFDEFLAVRKPHMQLEKDIARDYIQPLLEEYLTRGQYPAVIHADTENNKIVTLEKIFRTWIDKDFRYYTDTSYQGDFVKILQWMCLQTGNFAKIQTLNQEFSLQKKVVQDMITFLVDSFVAYPVSPYFSDKTKEYNHAISLYLHDTGLLNYLRGNFTTVISDGKITETFVAQQLIQLKNLGKTYYYKKKNGSEIDFIFETSRGDILPIEVKSKNLSHVPPAFFGFNKKYKEHIINFLVTARDAYYITEKNDLQVQHVPYRYMYKYVGGLLDMFTKK